MFDDDKCLIKVRRSIQYDKKSHIVVSFFVFSDIIFLEYRTIVGMCAINYCITLLNYSYYIVSPFVCGSSFLLNNICYEYLKSIHLRSE